MRLKRTGRSAILPTLLVLAVMLLGTALVLPHGASAAPSAPAKSNALAPSQAPLLRAWSHVLAPFAATLTTGDFARGAGLPPAKIRAILEATPYASADPAAVLTAMAQFSTFFSLGDYLGGFVEGCAVGGIAGGLVGSVVPGLGTAAGAGVGCVIGGAAADVALYLATNTAIGAQQAVELQFQISMAAQLFDDVAYTDGLVTVAQSVLNSTGPAFATMADHVALEQLPNVTFDPLQDMNRSGVAAQLTTLVQDYANALAGGVISLNQAEVGAYGPGGGYATTCNYDLQVSASEGWGFGCLPSGTQFYQAVTAALEGSGGNGEGVAFNAGGSAWIYCSGGSGSVYLDTAGGTAGSQTLAIPEDSAYHHFVPRYTAVWVIRAPTGANCDLVGVNFLMVPPAAGAPTSQLVVVGCGYQVVPTSSNCDPTNVGAGAFVTKVVATEASFQSRGGSGQQSLTYTLPGTTASYFVQMNAAMVQAETNARAYWSFLHILGYNSSSQIPSNCIVPMPDQVLPPQYDQGLGTLTLNQSLSLYEAWMNGLATFFNTPPGAANWCAGHQPFGVADSPWNLNTQITGWVLTLPQGNQSLTNRSTWTVTNASVGPNRVGNRSSVGLRGDPTPLVIWPTVKTLNARIGSVQEVPTDDPLDAYVPANGTLYELNGNGTAAGAHGFSNGTTSGSAGSAIFIATCQVRDLTTGLYGNAPGGYCPLTLSSILNVTFNISSPSPAPVPGASGACGNAILNQLAAPFAGLPVIAAFACAIAYVVVFVIILVVVFVAIALVRAYRNE